MMESPFMEIPDVVELPAVDRILADASPLRTPRQRVTETVKTAAGVTQKSVERVEHEQTALQKRQKQRKRDSVCTHPTPTWLRPATIPGAPRTAAGPAGGIGTSRMALDTRKVKGVPSRPASSKQFDAERFPE